MGRPRGGNAGGPPGDLRVLPDPGRSHDEVGTNRFAGVKPGVEAGIELFELDDELLADGQALAGREPRGVVKKQADRDRIDVVRVDLPLG